MERLFTAEETAEILHIKTDTVRRYIRSGKIRAAKLGKGWRISEEAIKAFVDSQTPQEKR